MYEAYTLHVVGVVGIVLARAPVSVHKHKHITYIHTYFETAVVAHVFLWNASSC